MVRFIHQWLVANDCAEHRLDEALLDLTEAQPDDTVMALLRVAPSCDRYGAHLPRGLRPPQPITLYNLAQATVVMWKMLQEPPVPHILKVYFPRLFVHLLFQVFLSTEEMPEEVDTFWKGCQEEHGLATSPNRFAVWTLKSLLCQKQYNDVVVAMEHRCGWDTLLSVDTRHYAVALLAREMSCVSIPSCSQILRYLLWLLRTREPRWDLPALAFLVEVLECLDLREHDADRVLQIFSRYLQSECRERRRLVFKALLKLTDDPLMVRSGQWLKP
ncbi:uncharacterized protein GJ701_006549 [Geothlypis trichas]